MPSPSHNVANFCLAKTFLRPLGAAVAVLWAGLASAQGSEAPDPYAGRPWEIEIHAGWARSTHPTGGSESLPTTGTVVSNLVSASTFYFGSGTQLFNQNQTNVDGASATIAALDPVVLGSAITWRPDAASAGLRVNRAIGRRLSVEIAAEYGPGTLAFTNQALSAIEATRASVVPALGRALGRELSAPVTSVATVIDRQSASQVFTTAALLVNLRRTGRTMPYLVGGAGGVLRWGSAPAALLVGTYRFGAPSQVIGTDAVSLRYSLPNRDYVGIGGGGLKYHASPRWGLRFDARAHLMRNRISNTVDVTPSRALESGGAPFPIVTSGPLQFSSTAPLTGPSLFGVTTFSGRGYQARVSVTAGLFWRF